MSELVGMLRHLVRLDNNEYGGPYEGIAARECVRYMGYAADEIERLMDIEEAYNSMEPVAYRIYLPGWGEELAFTLAGAEEIAGNVEIVTERAAIITPLYAK